MKLYNRFALLAVLATVFGSALVMGCGGGSDEAADNAVTPASSAAPKDAAE